MKIHIIAISFVLFYGDLFKFCLRWLNKDASRKFASIICSNQSRQAFKFSRETYKSFNVQKDKIGSNKHIAKTFTKEKEKRSSKRGNLVK